MISPSCSAASQKSTTSKKCMSTKRDKAIEEKSNRTLTANRREDIIESFHNSLFTTGLPLGNLSYSFFGFDSPGFDSPGFRFFNRFIAETLAADTSLACFSSASLRALEVVLSLASKEVTRARALARETVNKMTRKVNSKSKVARKEYKGKTTETKIRTLRFVGSFTNLKTFSAKR
jgi:hypothetical protein